MGYNISIGEAVIVGGDEGYDYAMHVGVQIIDRPDAPIFPNDDSGTSNYRQPAYNQWRDMAARTGLTELFYGDVGIMRAPGAFGLVHEHHRVIETALNNWRTRYPNAVPQYDHTDEDGILLRLIWLEWWVRWALDNCQRPTFRNS